MNKILVLDIETTGLTAGVDFILELGMVELDLDTGRIIHLFDETFKSHKLRRKHHKSWIFENNYMNIEVIKNSKPIEEYKDNIQGILDQYQDKVYAWNNQFDFKFLRYEGFDLGVPTRDPMVDSTNYFQLPHKNGRGCCKWPKAQEAWDILFPQDPRTELHRGLDDADMEAAIIYELINRGVYHP